MDLPSKWIFDVKIQGVSIRNAVSRFSNFNNGKLYAGGAQLKFYHIKTIEKQNKLPLTCPALFRLHSVVAMRPNDDDTQLWSSIDSK